MKKTVLTILLLLSSVAMAESIITTDGYSSVSAMDYTSVGGAYGTETPSSGGFCSTSGLGCTGNTAGILGGPMPLGVVMETGAGAGIDGYTGDISRITAGTPNAGTYTSIQSGMNGGYVNPSDEFVVSYLNGGVYITQANQGGSNPITLGSVNGSVIAEQAVNGDTTVASRSDTVAVSGQGTAESYTQILVNGQAVAP